ERRVFEATGVRLRDIPVGIPDDVIGGKILCRRGDEYVITVGYPDYEDDDGCEVWEPRPENFRRVVLSARAFRASDLDYEPGPMPVRAGESTDDVNFRRVVL
ncbi:MAG: hypothetical protein Q8Q14_02685, partial [Gemmatimonadales bacterium]|nr:hypothetical protein [Gemmatimonadales bacterium]